MLALLAWVLPSARCQRIADEALLPSVLLRTDWCDVDVASWTREGAMLTRLKMLRESVRILAEFARPLASGRLIQAADCLRRDLTLGEQADRKCGGVEHLATRWTLVRIELGEAARAEEMTYNENAAVSESAAVQ
jgi:hypothetical protein